VKCVTEKNPIKLANKLNTNTSDNTNNHFS
jgi:hypothetical protein